MYIFTIPSVHRLLLCIWFSWTPSVPTLVDVKGLRGYLGCVNSPCGQRSQCVTSKPVNSYLGWESSFPVSVASKPAKWPSKQTAKAAAVHKQEVSSLNLNLSLRAWLPQGILNWRYSKFISLNPLKASSQLSEMPSTSNPGIPGLGAILMQEKLLNLRSYK